MSSEFDPHKGPHSFHFMPNLSYAMVSILE